MDTPARNPSDRAATQVVDSLPALSGFPWVDADLLTPVLREPRLWARAFAATDRKAVKAAAKHVLQSGRLEIHDDGAIGEAVVALLTTRAGRKALYRQLEHHARNSGRQVLAEQLRDTLKADGRWRIHGGLTVQRQMHRLFLDPDLLAAWLSELPRDHSGTNDVVLSVTAFAILQPSEAIRFADILERYGWGTRDADGGNAGAAHLVELPPVPVAEMSSTSAPSSATVPAVADEVLPLAERTGASVEPRLARVAAAVTAHVVARQRLADLALASRYGEVGAASQSAQQAEAAMFDEARAVLTAAGLPAAALPPFPPGQHGDDTSRAWLDELAVLIERADADRKRHVVTRRDALISALERYRIDVPDELRAVTAHDELAGLAASLEPRIEAERILADLRAADSPEPLAALPSPLRALLCERLFRMQDASDLALRCFARYGASFVSIDLDVAMQAITDALLSERALPPGLWTALSTACGGAMLGLLDSHGASELIAAGADTRSWEFTELLDLLANTDLSATHPLAPRVLAHRTRRLPPDERVFALARGALSSGTDAWVRVLVGALCETGRMAEALMLGKAWSTSSPGAEPPGNALLSVLIEATQHPQRYDVLRAVVSGPLDLVIDRESFLVYLAVAAYVEPSRVDVLIAQHPRHLADVAEAHPVLLQRWLLRFHRDGVPSDELAQEEVALARARDAFKSWQHGLERKSSYGGWDFALDYQARLNARLRAWFDHLEQHGVLPPMQNTEELLDETGRSHGLPPVEGSGRRSMLSYLEQQIGGLHAFESVADLIPRGQLGRVLASPRISLRASIEEEMKGARGLVVKLYERARKELRA